MIEGHPAFEGSWPNLQLLGDLNLGPGRHLPTMLTVAPSPCSFTMDDTGSARLVYLLGNGFCRHTLPRVRSPGRITYNLPISCGAGGQDPIKLHCCDGGTWAIRDRSQGAINFGTPCIYVEIRSLRLYYIPGEPQFNALFKKKKIQTMASRGINCTANVGRYSRNYKERSGL